MVVTRCDECGTVLGFCFCAVRRREARVNMWGTDPADVGEGFCPWCERDEPRHYAGCPTRQSDGREDLTVIPSERASC